jgi:hypothetical protein
VSRVDDALQEARRLLDRLTPEEAWAEARSGALLVDTRTAAQRARQGDLPGALVIDRTVLEWRLDPTSPVRIPEVHDAGVRVVVMPPGLQQLLRRRVAAAHRTGPGH